MVRAVRDQDTEEGSAGRETARIELTNDFEKVDSMGSRSVKTVAVNQHFLWVTLELAMTHGINAGW